MKLRQTELSPKPAQLSLWENIAEKPFPPAGPWSRELAQPQPAPATCSAPVLWRWGTRQTAPLGGQRSPPPHLPGRGAGM